jgi:hypothetical protein
MSDKTGGPAFPVAHTDMVIPGQSVKETQGMTLRDWFAGKALEGMLAGRVPAESYECRARDAYRYADIMLKEREN